jgi:hypothetical protein
MAITLEANEQVLTLEGDFDAMAFCRVQDFLRAATASALVVLDFHRVRFCQPFALAKVFELMARSEGSIRAWGLSQQHHVLLGYLGLLETHLS